MRSDEGPSFACNIAAIAPEERSGHLARLDRLFKVVALERKEIEDGFAFTFPPGELKAVMDFVVQERKCCPFLTFTLAFGPEPEPISLTIKSAEGGREIVQRELLA